MTFYEIDRRNPGTLRQTEVVNEDGVAHAHLVEGVAAHRRHLQAVVGAVNFDQCGWHRDFRAASCSRNRHKAGNLESSRKNSAEILVCLSGRHGYQRYLSFTRYTETLYKPVSKRKKQHKLIKLGKTFTARVASKAQQMAARLTERECLEFKVLAFEPISACRVVGVKNSCSRGVSSGLKSKNTGKK